MNLKLTWELQSENVKFLLLKIGDEPWKEVYLPLFKRHLKGLCQCKTREDLEEKFAFLENKLCKASCFRLLSVKGYFSHELEEKLSQKCFSKKAILYALEECKRLYILDDVQESERLAKHLQKKGYGARYIAAKMREKGMNYSAELQEHPQVAIRRLLEGKLRNRSKEKAIAALCRRGFDYHTILDVLKIKDPL